MKQNKSAEAIKTESLKLSSSLRILEAIRDLLPPNLVFVPEAGTMFTMGFFAKRVYYLGEEVNLESDGFDPIKSRPAKQLLAELQAMNASLIGEVVR
jgi:hypothetical protein